MTTNPLEAQILEFLRTSVDGSTHTENLIIACYLYLSRHTLSSRVQGLSSFALKAFEKGCISVKDSDQVKTLSFMRVGNESASNGCLVAPPRFTETLRQTPITRLGDLVYMGSHIADFVCCRSDSNEDRKHRASAYEAEFFQGVKDYSIKWDPESHQEKLLEDYPRGLDTPGTAWYPIRFIEA